MTLFQNWYQNVIPEHIQETEIRIEGSRVAIACKYDLKLQAPSTVLAPIGGFWIEPEFANLMTQAHDNTIWELVISGARQNIITKRFFETSATENSDTIVTIPISEQESLIWQALHASASHASNRASTAFGNKPLILRLFWYPESTVLLKLQVSDQPTLLPDLENFTSDITRMMGHAEQEIIKEIYGRRDASGRSQQ